MAVADVSAHPSARAASRARAIRRFRWSILGPLIALFAFVLLPVLFLQLYFSFHQWTVYLGSWWEADLSGSNCSARCSPTRASAGRSCARFRLPTGSTIGCFVLGLRARLSDAQAVSAATRSIYVIFILPMLTVPIVVAYTAEMLLYQSGPVNDIISRLTGHAVQGRLARRRRTSRWPP